MELQEIIYFKYLPTNATIKAQQLTNNQEHLNAALKKKRPHLVNQKGVWFHQDNDRAYIHTAKITSEKIEELVRKNVSSALFIHSCSVRLPFVLQFTESFE